ncbi:phosphatase [Tissierella sp. Yu-01]|uniref:phosphatase n=1 Tax=Tissierella sp. Yu-01 TaxID=3035694 RepID=UPI00240D76FF|nr:phosphatase [Tissierella sp. Yu-01]WFA08409.1 phosphatase [Tissierella sp. Yu-01]
MSYLIDMHNHTISSGHAYSTIQEIAKVASDKGLKYVGITDHGPSLQGAANIWHIGNLRVVPETIYGVNILKGVEANILNEFGDIDVPEKFLEHLDIVLAGLHEGPSEIMDVYRNTQAVLNVMENKYVDIIVHLGNPRFPIHYEEIVLKAKETNKLIEINNSSLHTSRSGSKDNCLEIALICKKYNVPMIFSSDSHISFDVGRFDEIFKLLEGANIPEELIINSTVERFENYMKAKGKHRFVQ